jgi:hypothetical protein
MKALSVLQPFAQLLVLGRRRFEVRPWHSRHRGRLAIHASSRFPLAQREACRRPPLCELLEAVGIEEVTALPFGALVGEADLVDCRIAEEVFEEPAFAEAQPEMNPGWWVWVFERQKRYDQPQTCRGWPGVFEVGGQ